jgi:hypothetical protein
MVKINKGTFILDFSLVIILLVGSVVVEPNHSSLAVIYAHTSSGSHNTTHNDNVSYWEWKGSVAKNSKNM